MRQLSYKMHRTNILVRGISFILLGMLLVGCGKTDAGKNSQQTLTNNRVGEEINSVYYDENLNVKTIKGDELYSITLSSLPNAEKEFTGKLPKNAYISDFWSVNGQRGNVVMVGERVYRLVSMRETDGEVTGLLGNYLQYIDPPYEKWEMVCPDREGESLEEMHVSEDNRLIMTYYSLVDDKMYATEYAVTVGDETINGQKEEIGNQQSDEAQNSLEYEKLRVGEIEAYGDLLSDNPAVIEEDKWSEMYSVAMSSSLCTYCDNDGTIYFGSENKLWKYEGENIKELMDFRKENVVFKGLEGICVKENGFAVLGSAVGKYYLLQAEKTDTKEVAEKTKIVLADIYLMDMVKDAVANFNMQSRKYEVEIRTLPIGPSDTQMNEFISNIQKEMLKGEGPDILSLETIDSNPTAYANNGYLMPMDDFFRDKEDALWPVALAGGTVDGKRYGIPYDMYLSYLMGDAAKLPKTESWSAAELMKYVRKSDAKYVALNRYLTNTHLEILSMLLNDPADHTYLDWDNGISHLNEKPFREMLEFIKEYSYTETYNFDDVARMLHGGEAALFSTNMNGLLDLLFQYEFYEGKPGYIGFPSVEGTGVDCYTDYLYVNANTKNKEGVEAFFEYLLSDAGQTNAVTTNYMDALPIRKETFRWMLETKGEYTSYGRGTITMMGTSFQMDYLTEEQKEQAIYLVEHARPYNPDFQAIRGILMEETTPYFQGQKSVEAVMDTLHRRVQLYMDERK